MLRLGYENMDNYKNKFLKLGRHVNDKKTLDLFRNVVYEVDDRMPEFTKIRVSKLESCKELAKVVC